MWIARERRRRCRRLAGACIERPDDLLAKVPEMEDKTTFGFQPLLGGLSPEASWKSLELLKKTMRRLKAAIAVLD